ncbi:MAG: hypothetical protein GY851_35580 [bacterium]|nr:hypothetical protein [bacterium]
MPSADTQFKAGNPGGPGRPVKAKCIPDLLRKIGEEGGETPEVTKLETVLRQVYMYALEGKSWAVEFIADRTEGRAKQSIEIDGSTATLPEGLPPETPT